MLEHEDPDRFYTAEYDEEHGEDGIKRKRKASGKGKGRGRGRGRGASCEKGHQGASASKMAKTASDEKAEKPPENEAPTHDEAKDLTTIAKNPMTKRKPIPSVQSSPQKRRAILQRAIASSPKDKADRSAGVIDAEAEAEPKEVEEKVDIEKASAEGQGILFCCAWRCLHYHGDHALLMKHIIENKKRH